MAENWKKQIVEEMNLPEVVENRLILNEINHFFAFVYGESVQGRLVVN